MSTARPFSYNTGSAIAGTEQVGDIAIGFPTAGFVSTGLPWWNGPNEELGYVICKPVPSGTQPTPLPGIYAFIGFSRTDGFDDNKFIQVTNTILSSNYTNAIDASLALTTNGYWNSYPVPVLYLDAGNPSSYPGSGTVWTDLIGGKIFNLINGPAYESGDGGKIGFYAPASQYAECSTSLQSLTTFTISVWHYWDGNNTGGEPCILTEIYPGNTGAINYVLGSQQGSPTRGGYFNGGFQSSPIFSLTPDTWYNIVVTCDAFQEVKIYLNNTLISTTQTTGPSPSSSEGGIRLMRRWDNPEFWGGYLGIVSMYNKALNSAQISSIWNKDKNRFGL